MNCPVINVLWVLLLNSRHILKSPVRFIFIIRGPSLQFSTPGFSSSFRQLFRFPFKPFYKIGNTQDHSTLPFPLRLSLYSGSYATTKCNHNPLFLRLTIGLLDLASEYWQVPVNPQHRKSCFLHPCRTIGIP